MIAWLVLVPALYLGLALGLAYLGTRRLPEGHESAFACPAGEGSRDPEYHYFPAETDNVVVLLHEPGEGRERAIAAARYISAYGLAQVYASPTPGSSEAREVDAPLMSVIQERSPGAPIVLTRCQEQGRFDVRFTGGRYGEGAEVPELEYFEARDGARLAYRTFPSEATKLLILLHGASAQGEMYAALAHYLSHQGLAQVFVPNLRGHFRSGSRLGDVDYEEQLEDDLADFIDRLRQRHPGSPILLAAHSLSGGLAIRFAQGRHRHSLQGLALLSPYLGPLAPTSRSGARHGWVTAHVLRGLGLCMLHAVGIRALNHLKLLDFHPPREICDGTETPSYSFRMVMALSPPWRLRRALRAIAQPTLLLVGSRDEMFRPEGYAAIASRFPNARLKQVAGATHLGLVFHPSTHQALRDWLDSLELEGG